MRDWKNLTAKYLLPALACGLFAGPAMASDCTPEGLEGVWRVLTFGPDTLTERAEIAFVMGTRVSAALGCNRMIGEYTLAHGVLRAGPMAATRMACPQELMARDDRFAAMLTAGAACRLTDDGQLHLGTLSAPDLTAAR